LPAPAAAAATAATGSGKTLADIIQDYQDEADALRMGNKERERHNELVVNRTIQDYLDGDRKGKGGANLNDAAQFGFVPPGATLEETRSVIREIHGAEIFVTLTGQKAEMALIWLTDDLLKGT
jgi:hypothetical protein